MYGTAQCIGRSSEKFTVLAQGACTLIVLGSMQPEHKIPEVTGTVSNIL